MSDTVDTSADTGTTDAAVSAAPTASSDSGASQASGSNAASSGLTDDHHDWATAFTGIDTRAGSSSGAATASASSDDSSGGGFFSGIANAVSDAASGIASTAGNVVSDVGQTVSDAASGIASTVSTVAGDVGNAVSNVASGVADTAGTVASDIGSGHFGDALGDAASGIVSTTGHAISDVAHTAVDAGSGMLSTAGKIVTDADQTVTDAATGVISTAGKAVSDTAQGVAQAAGPDSMLGQAAGAVGSFSTSAASGLVDTVNTVNDFNKGVTEGVVAGVDGLAQGVVSLGDSVGKEGFALATDEKAREQAGQTILHGAEAVGQFAETAVDDPSKALGQVEDAAGSAVNTVKNVASNAYQGYQAAAAQGHGAEFIGKGVGQAGVMIAGAVLTDGASLEAEGTAALGEGVAAVGEVGTALEEGTGVVEETSALASGEPASEVEASVETSAPPNSGVTAGTAEPEVPGGGDPAGEPPAGEAKGQLSRDEGYLAEGDPARQVMGAAKDSHPEEIAEMQSNLEADGVEIKEREGAIAYSPGLKPGSPGQITLDPDSSYSAWLHEYQHYLDDKAAGWGGMKGMMDVANRARMEESAYAKEIELATSLGHEDVANELRENLAKELATIKGEE